MMMIIELIVSSIKLHMTPLYFGGLGSRGSGNLHVTLFRWKICPHHLQWGDVVKIIV